MPVLDRMVLAVADAVLEGVLIFDLLIADCESDVKLLHEGVLLVYSLEGEHQILRLLNLNPLSVMRMSWESKWEDIEGAGVRLTIGIRLREQRLHVEIPVLPVSKYDTLAAWITMALARAGIDIDVFTKFDH